MVRFAAVRAGALGLAVAAIVVAAGVGLVSERRRQAADLTRARDLHGGAFAGATACAACHPEHVTSWRRTYHRTMTQEVSAKNAAAVAGDFSGVTYRYGATTARMHRDESGRFVMSFEGPGDSTVDAVVVRAVGSRRYQQYLARVDGAGGGGALWRLPMAWHVEERRWFHMNGAFLTPDPEDTAAAGGHLRDDAVAAQPRFGGGDYDRHVTRWNDNCVFCHNVAPNPGRQADTGAFRTTVAELGVACEACHGPGGEHARANLNPVRRYLLHGGAAADPTIVNPSRLSSPRAADVCGRCHGQRITDQVAPFLDHGDPFVPGDDLALYSAPLWRDTPLGGDRRAFAARFWDDGTARLTAYEYQGLLQSRCAQVGTLTCTTCHGMHEGDPRGQLRPGATGDGACLGCHAGFASAQHTRHRADGAGARCVSCHMPRVVYGVLDVHPSHRIERPEPARAAAAGRPDACTLCHVERDVGWAARERARLWPAPDAGAAERPPVSFEGGADTAPRTAAFAGDPIARAVAVDAIGRAPWPDQAAARARVAGERAGMLLEVVAGDRYPAVRHLAARALAAVLDAGAAGAADAAVARSYDSTAPAAVRAQVVTELRRRLGRAAAPDPARIAGLRVLGRQVDIDIGE